MKKTNSGVCFATAYGRTIFPCTTNKVKISGPNRSVEITDQYFSCISVNVIYRTSCKLYNKIYVGEIRRRLADRFREHIRDVMMWKKTTQMRQKQSRAILIFLVIPTSTWQFALFTPWKHGKPQIFKKNIIFQLGIHAIHRESMNVPPCINLFTNSRRHLSTNGKARTHTHKNQQQPIIPLFALTKARLTLETSTCQIFPGDNLAFIKSFHTTMFSSSRGWCLGQHSSPSWVECQDLIEKSKNYWMLIK